MKVLKILILAGTLLISACSSSQNPETTSQQNSAALIYTAAALTDAASTETPAPPTPLDPEVSTETPLPPTISPRFEAMVAVNADLLNLRSGPSTFFNTITTLSRGMQVSIQGMIEDGTWIYVNALLNDGNSIEGWIFASLLDLSTLETSLPIVSLPAESTISGIVADTDGTPINAVRVAATVQTETGTLRAESNSNRSGYFYIYAPPDLTGPINIEIVAVNCSSSISDILSDGSCIVRDFIPVTWRAEVSLPQSQLIRFTYEQGVALLEGKVIYQDGNGASQILVKATRQSDGVESEYVTPQGGEFRLPLGLGTWDFVAIRFLEDGTPLFSETRVFQITTPGQEFEPLLISYTEIIER